MSKSNELILEVLPGIDLSIAWKIASYKVEYGTKGCRISCRLVPADAPIGAGWTEEDENFVVNTEKPNDPMTYLRAAREFCFSSGAIEDAANTSKAA